jgi:lipopolysaccharide transport system ATP-binding protein
MREVVIQAEGLSKRYRIGSKRQRYRTLRDTLSHAVQAPLNRLRLAIQRSKDPALNGHDSIWALKDVSFNVERGEVLGIIGRNGAGKSTLLKILSRITEPTEGYVDLCGRLGSLLEVGTGFHPELTGRENIFLNGAILGMKRAEIVRKFDEIVAFAEVEKFIDTPVKRYSSGMYLRLAFSLAAHLEPEILLVDEVLAVGDITFQRRCIGKMGEVAGQGRTVLFVSHNMAALRQLCSSAMLLSDGRVIYTGETERVIRQYLGGTLDGIVPDLLKINDRKGQGRVKFASIRFEDQHGNPIPGLICGQPARVVLGVKGEQTARRVRVALTFRDHLDQRVMFLDSKLLGFELPELSADDELVCEIPRVHLAPGRYRLELWLQSATELQDWITDSGMLDVIDGNFFGTGRALPDGYQMALMDFNWKIESPVASARAS